MKKQQLLWGALLCLTASISWGAMFPVANHSFTYIEPFYFTIFRYIPVALILVVILWMKEGKQAFRTEGKGWLLWFFGTMAFTIYNLFIFWGQDILGETGVLLASIMESLMPLLSVLLIWFLTKQKPGTYTLFFISLAFIGVLLVVTKGDIGFLLNIHQQLFPFMILLMAVSGWVVYTIGGDRFQHWSTLRYSTLTCLYGTITSSVIVLLVSAFGWIEVPSFHNLYVVRYDMLFMIIFPGLIALLGWNVGVRILKPINSLLFISFVPVTTLAIGFIQGYDLTVYDMVGTGFIVLALLLNNLYERITVRNVVPSKILKTSRY